MRILMIVAAVSGLVLASVQATGQEARPGSGKIKQDPPAKERGPRGDKGRAERGERGAERGERGERAERGERPGQPPVGPLMEALDRDRDGQLSEAEIAGAAQSLMKLDRDGDGRLSKEELRPAPRGGSADRAVAQLMAHDTDGDGKLAKDELPERMQRIFDRADADASGYLEQAEIEAVASRVSGRRGGDRPGQPDDLEGATGGLQGSGPIDKAGKKKRKRGAGDDPTDP